MISANPEDDEMEIDDGSGREAQTAAMAYKYFSDMLQYFMDKQ